MNLAFAVTAVLFTALVQAVSPTQTAGDVFVGTTPCDAVPRAFAGGLAANAPCHAITWRLSLEPRGPSSRWSLVATYGIPPAHNPNQMIDGPKVSIGGTYSIRGTSDRGRTAASYRLVADRSGRELSFVQVSNDLLHLLTSDGRLMVGNAGWSYTLNRASRSEKPGNPAAAADFTYPISPRAKTSVFGIFEGRTPCAGIARELGVEEFDGCIKVKWRVTLFQDPATLEPTTYKIEGTLHRQQAREGRWRIARGGDPDSGGTIYELAPSRNERALYLLRGDDNVLFFVNQTRQHLVGHADFSYTLNRVAR